MRLFENIQAISDHFVIPVKVLNKTRGASAKISVPGKRPVQIKAAVELLQNKGLMKNITVSQLDDCVRLRLTKAYLEMNP